MPKKARICLCTTNEFTGDVLPKYSHLEARIFVSRGIVESELSGPSLFGHIGRDRSGEVQEGIRFDSEDGRRWLRTHRRNLREMYKIFLESEFKGSRRQVKFEEFAEFVFLHSV